jgi:hypothetical protein
MEVVWSGYQFNEPFSIFRKARINLNQHSIWDFGGNRNSLGGNINGFAQFKNYWSMHGGLSVTGEQLFNTALRGGPALKVPGSKNLFYEISTNPQKKLTFEIEGFNYFSNEKNFRKISEYSLEIGYRPLKSLSIEVTPGLERYSDDLMYVTQQSFKSYNSDMRYIMSHIERNTVNMSLRINYNITPELTIQYWGQPFVATGDYTEFKHITDSKADELIDRYHIYTNEQISFDEQQNEYFIDDNIDGIMDYSFEKPDFNVKEFLSNLVVRWEYMPGSTVYFVWSQTRNHYVNDGAFDISNDIENLFSEGANNVFLIKLSYRFGR